MDSINWQKIFQEICNTNEDILNFGLIENWFQVEIYRKLKKWELEVLESEPPYNTFFPVDLSKKKGWKEAGATTWADLCISSKTNRNWVWFELKVRHVGRLDREEKAAKEARDVFRKDVVKLGGFDKKNTYLTWKDPDKNTKSYWFDEKLKPRLEDLKTGEHHFVAAFLQIGGELNNKIWNEEALRKEIKKWYDYRNKDIKRDFDINNIKIFHKEIEVQGFGLCNLILCEW